MGGEISLVFVGIDCDSECSIVCLLCSYVQWYRVQSVGYTLYTDTISYDCMPLNTLSTDRTTS